MGKNIIKVVVIASGVVGIIIASVMALASLLLAGYDSFYDNATLIVSLTGILGSIILALMGMRLSESNVKVIGLLCIFMSLVFITATILFSAPIVIISDALCLTSGVMCLLFRRFTDKAARKLEAE